MESNINISKKHIITIFIASVIIVICNNLEIDSYIKNIIIPFTVMLISYIYILKDSENLNKKAYYLLIPIFLVLISKLVVNVDYSNLFLNVFILVFLITTFLFLLTNKNYSISIGFSSWIFKLFPNKVFNNLKFLKIKDSKNNNIINTLFGILIGCCIGIVIISLLMSADDYFNAFIGGITDLINFDFSNFILLIVSFIILFSIIINVLLNKKTKMEKVKTIKVNEIIVTTALVIVNVTFLLFLFSEVSRLTINFLQLPVKFTYSSYAREGFFQLLFVALINYTIIMFLLYKSNIIKKSDRIKKLSLLLISFSVALIFNSFYRMFLYMSNYGFTVLRLQVILFLIMGLILFAILAKKIISNLKNDFFIYFIIILSFYLLNLYLCSDSFINMIRQIY